MISIDVGGTFTDCIVYQGSRIIRTKTPTTRHNLSAGFRQAIEEAAAELGLSLTELLTRTDHIRYSTTLALNALIERNGPRLGLITTAGHEHLLLIGRSRQWADGLSPVEVRDMSRIRRPEPLIPLERVVGVRERCDCFGRVVEPLDEEDVRQKVQVLVDQGVRGFVVCLLWSFLNPAHEQRIKEIILDQYPSTYLGHMPVMLSSAVHPKWHEYPRANVTILNAYLQGDMNRQLRGLGDDLRDLGYKKPLAIINNSGGMAKVTRTRPVETYAAGPIAGLFGAAHLGRLYGFENIIVSDMGGTSFDYGLIRQGRIEASASRSTIDRWLTETAMIDVRSIGAGGGSIAWLNQALANTLEVGPQSAGSLPGPACYNQGGRRPTVTDADLVLGYLNPAHFLGGKIRIRTDLAAGAIASDIGRPLGLDLDAAAAAIRRVVDAKMGNQIAKDMYLKGLDPKDFVLFAYGGAGPTHACHYAESLGVDRVVAPLFASVFCALGGATMDVRHTYERSRHVPLWSPVTGPLQDPAPFNDTLAELQRQAALDMASEGVDPGQVRFELHLGMRFQRQMNLTRIRSPLLTLQGAGDVERLLDSFRQQYVEQFTSAGVNPDAAVEIEEFYLTAIGVMPKVELPRLPRDGGGAGAGRAHQGRRPVYWPEFGSRRETDIYAARLLQPGHRLAGPAVIESADTTFVIPPGWECNIDDYGNGLIEKRP